MNLLQKSQIRMLLGFSYCLFCNFSQATALSFEYFSIQDGLTGGSFAGTNGWTAEDMFQTNRDQYGVKSSYNPDLPEYT